MRDFLILQRRFQRIAGGASLCWQRIRMMAPLRHFGVQLGHLCGTFGVPPRHLLGTSAARPRHLRVPPGYLRCTYAAPPRHLRVSPRHPQPKMQLAPYAFNLDGNLHILIVAATTSIGRLKMFQNSFNGAFKCPIGVPGALYTFDQKRFSFLHISPLQRSQKISSQAFCSIVGPLRF